jgi:DNA-binding NarL/FixJ family response regulator
MKTNSSRRSLGVFLVEDSIQVRRQLVALIGTISGVEIVGEAEDSSSALRGIEASRADVAILDFHLKESSGMDIIKGLAESCRPVITIVLTNHATQPVREACLSAGANHFFDKTNEFSLALDTIATLARQRLAGATE